jgi:hypothetical protein
MGLIFEKLMKVLVRPLCVVQLRYLAVLVALHLVACSGAKPTPDGKWQLTGQTGATGAVAAQIDKLKGSSTVQLDKDGKFDMSMGAPIKGTWQATGNNVTLSVTEVQGMSIADIEKKAASMGIPTSDMHTQMTGTMSDDGKTLNLGDPKTPNQKLVFTRAAS